MSDSREHCEREFKPSDAAGPKRIGYLARAKWISLSRLRERDLKCCRIWQLSKRWTRRDSGHLVDWVRPLLGVERWRDFGFNTPMTIYLCAFTTPSGRELPGFIHGWRLRDLGMYEFTRPTIVLGSKHVTLWKGNIPPMASELKRDYRVLGETSQSLFPLRIRTIAKIADDISKLTAKGFYFSEPGPIRFSV